jgi:hypothetical protein
MIEQAFLAAGWKTCSTYRAPKCPDFFAAKNKRTIAVECKSEDGSLTKDQQEFMDEWPGEYYVVSTLDEAQQILGAK